MSIAKPQQQKLTSFETILTTYIFNHVFGITNPASLYPQSVKAVESQVKQLCDEFENVCALCEKHELNEQVFLRDVYERRNAFPVNYATTKLLKIRKADVNETPSFSSFMPLIQPLCQSTSASYPTKPFFPTSPYLILRGFMM